MLPETLKYSYALRDNAQPTLSNEKYDIINNQYKNNAFNKVINNIVNVINRILVFLPFSFFDFWYRVRAEIGLVLLIPFFFYRNTFSVFREWVSERVCIYCPVFTLWALCGARTHQNHQSWMRNAWWKNQHMDSSGRCS